MKSDTFVVLSSMLESAKCLDDSLRNELCYVIMEYGFNGELVESSPIIKAIMMSIIPNINSSKSRYKASVDNGKLGGRPPKHKPNDNLDKPNDNLEETKTKPNSNLDKDKDKDKDVDKDKVIKQFTFSLTTSKLLSSTSKEYQTNLQEYINTSNHSMSYEDFYTQCEMKPYKYKNFKMAYDTWNKNSKQPMKSFKQQDKEKASNTVDTYMNNNFNIRNHLGSSEQEVEVISYDRN